MLRLTGNCKLLQAAVKQQVEKPRILSDKTKKKAFFGKTFFKWRRMKMIKLGMNRICRTKFVVLFTEPCSQTTKH